VKRKAVGFVLLTCSLIYVLHSLHLGILWRTNAAVYTISQKAAYTISQKIQVWLDKSPPTAPLSLSASTGPAPTIQHLAGYYNASHIPQHTFAPFDSIGGDVIVVYASSHENVLLTLSDNFNNRWITMSGPTNSSAGFDLRSQIWYARRPKVGPNHVLTINLSARQSLAGSVLVARDSNISDGPIDAFSLIGDDADMRTLTPISPKIVTIHPNDLLIGFGKSWSSKAWKAGTGFWLQPAASSTFHAVEIGLAATASNYNASFALDGHTNWQAALVAIKSAVRSNTLPITLSWQPSSDNTGVIRYQIERCSNNNCKNFEQVGTSSYTYFVDWTVPTAGQYKYRVYAIDAASNVSEYSDTIVGDARCAGAPEG
jgi:hypothetical protein